MLTVTDLPSPIQPNADSDLTPSVGALRSPIRPSRPEEPPTQTQEVPLPPIERPVGEDPQETLDHIRQKMERVALEFAEGQINRAQFNAIYAHYGEQRAIIERLISRNPDNEAWKQVARLGRTTFLRSHFEAQPQYYLVFRHRERQPLHTGGMLPPDSLPLIVKTLKQLWALPQMPTSGVARKPINDGKWLVVALGAHAVTLVIYSLQPSNAQAALIGDLHSDFERANRISLQRNLPTERMVFPQRSLFR
ncbi:MAG: hypothetical protein SF029_12690 [bacterium]|nr:hypothetical protein [bacterium]